MILISHHPTIVNNFVAHQANWFSRQEDFHTRVQEITTGTDTTGISRAELIERGWLL